MFCSIGVDVIIPHSNSILNFRAVISEIKLDLQVEFESHLFLYLWAMHDFIQFIHCDFNVALQAGAGGTSLIVISGEGSLNEYFLNYIYWGEQL